MDVCPDGAREAGVEREVRLAWSAGGADRNRNALSKAAMMRCMAKIPCLNHHTPRHTTLLHVSARNRETENIEREREAKFYPMLCARLGSREDRGSRGSEITSV